MGMWPVGDAVPCSDPPKKPSQSSCVSSTCDPSRCSAKVHLSVIPSFCLQFIGWFTEGLSFPLCCSNSILAKVSHSVKCYGRFCSCCSLCFQFFLLFCSAKWWRMFLRPQELLNSFILVFSEFSFSQIVCLGFLFLLGVLLKVVVLSVLLVTVFVRMPPYSLLSSQCFVRMEVVFCHSLQCCNFSSCILKVAP